MRDSLFGGPPLAKEIKNSASNRLGGDGQPLGEIMKKQPTVPPIGEQAPSPPQLDRSLPHSVSAQRSMLAGTALESL